MASNAPDNLSPKQEKAIAALLTEPTVERAAHAAGVGERTLYEWLDQPAFKAEYRRCRREAFSQAIALTQRYAPLAVQTLTKIMADPDSPAASRVQASNTLLKFGRDALELDDLAVRLDGVEAKMKQEQQPPPPPPQQEST